MSARMLRRLKLQQGVAGVIGLIAAAMTTVSLSHIAGGIAVITHGAVPDWQAWGCAIGLDANYIAMEMAGVVAAMQHVRNRLRRLTLYGIPAVMACDKVEARDPATGYWRPAWIEEPGAIPGPAGMLHLLGIWTVARVVGVYRRMDIRGLHAPARTS
jgi:hypothetical protein